MAHIDCLIKETTEIQLTQKDCLTGAVA